MEENDFHGDNYLIVSLMELLTFLDILLQYVMVMPTSR